MVAAVVGCLFIFYRIQKLQEDSLIPVSNCNDSINEISRGWFDLKEAGKLTPATTAEDILEHTDIVRIHNQHAWNTTAKMQGERTQDDGQNPLAGCSIDYPCVWNGNIQFYRKQSFAQAKGKQPILFIIDPDGHLKRYGAVAIQLDYDGRIHIVHPNQSQTLSKEWIGKIPTQEPDWLEDLSRRIEPNAKR
jgi:hypothetical protein